jgi:allantoicase
LLHVTEPDFVDCPDLAAERVGGAAIATNDDFFAEKENLLQAHPAEWRDHAYTHKGKWMDGWETRRRREAGFDSCVVRLGLPGVIKGVVVDTSWFKGNFPEACSVEAACLSGPLDLAQLQGASWVEVVPKSTLQGDFKNMFAVSEPRRFTHVRLNIFPDGGVARLRVHGEVVPDWAAVRRLGGPVDLAAQENGAHVVACSDMFFGSRHNLIKPDRAINMGDGWETKRRRGPGHDWSLVRLASEGILSRIEVDTTHFKGNAPGRCLIEACQGPRDAKPEALVGWRTVVESPLQPHTRHFFDEQLRRVGPVTHVRLSVYPDGGVARLRVWGDLSATPSPALAKLNGLSFEAARSEFLKVCGSSRWAKAMAMARPFEDTAALLRIAERAWWALDQTDHVEAFSAHPRIGQRSASAWSTQEQAAAASAPEPTLQSMAALNEAYFAKFGFIFIVCATGRPASDLVAQLEARLGHDTATEVRTAMEEQAKITRLRLNTWLSENTTP